MEPIEHISAEQIAEYGVVAAPDRLTGKAQENKAVFDRLVRELVAVVVNRIIDKTNELATVEDVREEAEESRVTAEQGRVTAETARVTAEQGRVTDEQGRVTAERGRVTAEQGRVTAERGRVTAEQGRVTAEQGRVTAERGRVTAEQGRVTAEQERATAETARAAAEQERAATEEGRPAAIKAAIETSLSEAQQAGTFDGEDGKSPYVGENGRWYEYGDDGWEDTGKDATGPAGKDGLKFLAAAPSGAGTWTIQTTDPGISVGDQFIFTGVSGDYATSGDIYVCTARDDIEAADGTFASCTITAAPTGGNVRGPKGEAGKDAVDPPDDLYYDAENHALFLTKDGSIMGEGAELPEQEGTGFDELTYGEDGYLHIKKDGQDVVDPAYIGGGGSGGGGVGSTMRLTTTLTSRSFSVMDSAATCSIPYSWTSVDTESQASTGPGTANWYVGSTRVAVQRVQQGANTFDVKPYLTAGVENAVKLVVQDAYGNSRTMVLYITVTAYSLTWNLEEMAVHGSDALQLRLVPTGQGSKTLKIAVDGTVAHTQTITTSGRAVNYSVAAQSHGAHKVTAWLEMTIDGETLSTDALTHVGVWLASGTTTAAVGVLDATPTVPCYGTTSIRWMAVKPGAETVAVTLKEGSKTVTTLTVDRTMQTWAYKAKATGTANLSIVADGVSAAVVVTVTSLGYDIKPVTNGLVLDLDPAGHSNTETGRANFGYADADGTNHPLTFSTGFDWDNGGFVQDEDGVTALVVKRGCSVTLDASLFSDNAKTNGKAIKVIFRAAKCRDFDAVVASSYAGGVGLRLYAQRAVLDSALESMELQYCEDTKMELDVNIEPAAGASLAEFWLRGVPSRAMVYTAQDDWTQSGNGQFVIGSDDCDVWVYRIKMYTNALERSEVLDNYIADCGDTEEIIARYERNDVYDTMGNVDRDKLAAAAPDLRIIHISTPRMTTSKSDEVVCDVSLTYTGGAAAQNFAAKGVRMKAQGTSSLEYILAALNLDLDFAKTTEWTDGDGNALTGYAMTPNAIPVTYLTAKLNVASSENANNAVLSDEYNSYQPWLSAARKADSRVRDTIQAVPAVVFVTNSSSSPIAAGARTIGAGETIMYGIADLCNSKKNFAVFGQNSAQWPDQCCCEIANNNNAQCRFKSADLTGETWDGDGNFEFRFPKAPTASMKAAWQTVLSWVVSTDASAATGDALTTPVVYGGVSYANDTANYRKAKFKAELADHFIVDSLLYHYLFTERHCMVDNRAKNTFPSYEYDADAGGYRWNFAKSYDHDTADGNDNSGGLTFASGLEDTDSVGSAKVFNASDSVLWVNLRDLMADELAAMFRDRENAGAWDAARILAHFAAHQSARPEALWAEDAWGKYFGPYLNAAETRYIDMMLGTKEDQRRRFEVYQEVYMASKYSGSAVTSRQISLRASAPETWGGVEPTGDMSITPYCDLYVTVKYGNAGTVKVRTKRGVKTDITCPADTLNDTETYIWAAHMLRDVGSLAGLYTKLADISAAVRLRKLVLGSAAAGYTNGSITSLSFGQNDMLEQLDLRGTPSLVQAMDLSALKSLKEVYISGSGITGVTFAVGAPVQTARLPAVSSLVAIGLADIETWAMDGGNLTSLRVERSPGIDTLALVKAAAGLQRGRLIGVDWEDDDADVLMRLASLSGNAGIDADGNAVSGFVLTGAATVGSATAAEKTAIEAAFPELQLTVTNIVPAYTVTFKVGDVVVDTQTVRSGGKAVEPVAAGRCETPTKAATVQYTYTFSGWDRSTDGITSDTVINAQFSQTLRSYTVEWYADAQESSLLQTATVEPYGDAAYTGADQVGTGGAIWTGFDGSSKNVTQDLKLHATFAAPVLPSFTAGTHDYLYSDEPNDDSAYTLAEFWGVLYHGKERERFAIGDKIKVKVDTDAFADTEIIFALRSFKHFESGETGATGFAGPYFGSVGLMNATHRMCPTNTNVGGFGETEMHTFFESTIYPALPQQWKSMIEKIKILSSAGATSATITETVGHLTLESSAELGWNVDAVPYKNEVAAGADEVTFGCYTDNNSRIKKYYNGTGAADYYWTRSPDATSSTIWRVAYNSGGANSNNASHSYGVPLGFCLKSNVANST